MPGESHADYIALPSEAPGRFYLEDGDDILNSRRASVCEFRNTCSLTQVNLPRAAVDTRLFSWACIGAICSSLISTSLFIMGSFPTHPTPEVYRTADPPRRISTYMNLDKVHRKNASDKFNPIDSFAYVVLQLKNDDSERKVYEDDRMYYSREGAIYPDDRHFLVTKEVRPAQILSQSAHRSSGLGRHLRLCNSETWTIRWNDAKSKALYHRATCLMTLLRTSTTQELWTYGCWITPASSLDTSSGTVLLRG